MTDPSPTTERSDAAAEDVSWPLWLGAAMLGLWISLMVGIPVLVIVIFMIFGIGAMDPAALQSSPLLGPIAALSTTIAWVVVFAVLLLLLHRHPRMPLRRALGLCPAAPGWLLWAAPLAGIACSFLAQIVASLFEDVPASPLEDLMKTLVGRVSISAMAILVAPIAEELFFRGFLFAPMLRRMGPAAAILLNSAVFTIVHVGSYRFEPALLLPVFLLGLLASGLRGWSGSVWPSVLAHTTFNTTSVTLYLLFNE